MDSWELWEPLPLAIRKGETKRRLENIYLQSELLVYKYAREDAEETDERGELGIWEEKEGREVFQWEGRL